MEKKELTNEQKEKLKKLYKAHAFRTLKRVLKTTFYLLGANLAVILLDGFYVHSEIFVFLGSLTSAVMVLRSNRLEIEKEYDTLREEVKKILEE